MVFLRNAIEESPKTQREIARDAGFANANALSMMKTGECKVPISRIPALAEALEIDAGLFLKTALREYHSEIWMTIEEYMRPKIGPVETVRFFVL
jgi:transcriptional regulator with XRE-family HTH domain